MLDRVVSDLTIKDKIRPETIRAKRRALSMTINYLHLNLIQKDENQIEKAKLKIMVNANQTIPQIPNSWQRNWRL